MCVMVQRFRLQAMLAIIVLLLVNAQSGLGCVCSQVYDRSTVVSDNYSCGGLKWNLIANSTVIAYGAIGYGACTGMFTNCECVCVEAGTQAPGENMTFAPSTSGANVTFTVTSSFNTIESCKPSDGHCGPDNDNDGDSAGRKNHLTFQQDQIGPTFITC